MAAGGPLHRQRRHRVVAAAAWEHTPLLQRGGGGGRPRRRLAPVSVPRPGAHHPVLDRDPRVREVHVAHRARGDDEVVSAPPRALALIDGEHYASVVRDALAELPYDVLAAVVVGGTEKLRGGEDYGVPLAADLDRALATGGA